MKRLGLVLVAVVMVVGLASCGGSSGPSEITADISGRWSVKWGDTGTVWVLALEQDADGVVSGGREDFAGYSHVTGRRTSSSGDYELFEESHPGTQGGVHYGDYYYRIKLQGASSFKGRVTKNLVIGDDSRDCQGTKLM